MLEAAVDNMNTFGRIAVCGVIAEYTDAGKRAAPDMLNVVYKRIRIQGYLATDYLNVYADFISTTSDHLRTGNMQGTGRHHIWYGEHPLCFHWTLSW